MKDIENNDLKQYETEVKEKWGHTNAYQEYNKKTKEYSKEKWENINNKMNNIFLNFSICMQNNESVDSEISQNLVKDLQTHISENYYQCTKEILYNLGQMYVLDERFKNNIDKHAIGTALFVSKAIKIYCNK